MTAPLRGLFVTGTDTGVGKTTVAAGLLRYALRRGRRPIPVKPAETGCDPEPADAVALQQAAGAPIPLPTSVPTRSACPRRPPKPPPPRACASISGSSPTTSELSPRAATSCSWRAPAGLLVPYSDRRNRRRPGRRPPAAAPGRRPHRARHRQPHRPHPARSARSGLRVAGVILNQTTIDDGPHASGNAALITAVTNTVVSGRLPFLPEAAPSRPRPPGRLAAGSAGPRDARRPAGLSRASGPAARVP